MPEESAKHSLTTPVQEPWTATRVRESLGERLDQAMTIASAIVQAHFLGERGVVVSGSADTFTAVEYSTTHRQVIAEGSKDEATAGAIAHIARQGTVSVEFLQSCVSSPEGSRAFMHGVFVAVQLLEQQAREAGIHPETTEHMSREICEQLGLRRGVDLRDALEMAGWDEESARAAGNIHAQLLVKGYVGWTVEEAEQCLRGGPDARGGLDDLEARLGIDVDRMRAVITFIGPDVSDQTLAELCEAHGLALRQGDMRDAGNRATWDWVNSGGEASNAYFATWREAAVAALEEAFANEWTDGGHDDALIDFIARRAFNAPRA